MISFYIDPGVVTLFLLIYNKFLNFSDGSLLSPGLEFDMRLSDGFNSVPSL